jgi:hypothetical protein
MSISFCISRDTIFEFNTPSDLRLTPILKADFLEEIFG